MSKDFQMDKRKLKRKLKNEKERNSVGKKARRSSASKPLSRNAGAKGKAGVKRTVTVGSHSEEDNPDGRTSPGEVKRDAKGKLVFEDYPHFQPNMSPKEVLQAGSFGGTYFRPIYSSITKQHYTDVWKELPPDLLQGLDISKQVCSSTYRAEVNRFKAKCGGSLEMWESSGWIRPQDPYGWFQWYCRFYQGRRTEDDVRQIARWNNCTGVNGRWRNNLISKVVRAGRRFDDPSVTPAVRQTLQHWGYELTLDDFRQGAKRVKLK